MAVLEMALERTPGGVIVRLKGAVDTSTVEDLDRSLSTLSSGGQKKVVVDLANVDYVNSRGMALFIKYNDIFSQKRGRFTLSGLNPRVKPTFELMGLLDALEVVEQPEDVFKTKKPEGKTHPVTCPGCEVSVDVVEPGYFRCSRCGNVFLVSRRWNARAAGGKKAHRVSVIIPMLPRYVSAVRAGIESLAVEFLHNQRKLWPVVDEILGFLVEKATKGRRKRFQMSVDLVADESRFVIVIILPKDIVISGREMKEEAALRMANKTFSKVDIAVLKPAGQVLRLEM